MPAQSDIRILVVDDFATMRRILTNILKQLGYNQVEEADDGADAFTKLKQSPFDFVITDWNMPKMNGLELLRAIRGDETLKKTPVLMVTAEALKENVLKAVQCGVNDYLVKPFTVDVMKQKMEKIFAGSGPP